MSFLLKSVVGLGAVYAAMFGPALKSGDPDSKATLCAIAAHAPALGGDEAGLRSQLLAAGCAISFNDAAQRLAASLTTAPAPPRFAGLPAAAPMAALPAPTPPPPPQTRPSAGSLTAADLLEPWYGVDPRARRPRKRG
jgi:hypothetical protein